MAEANLKNQIANLQKKLSKLQVNGSNNPSKTPRNNAGPSSRRRTRRRLAALRGGGAVAGSSAGYVASSVQNPINTKGFASQGSIRVSRRELHGAVNLGKNGSFLLHPSQLPWLSNIAKSFERITWHSCSLHFRSGTPTTVGGQFMMGVDWDSDATFSGDAVQLISCLTPSYEAPLWQSGVLPLPSSRLMTRKAYILRGEKTDVADTSPGIVLWNAGGTGTTEAGHLWIQYSVTLSGTTKAA